MQLVPRGVPDDVEMPHWCGAGFDLRQNQRTCAAFQFFRIAVRNDLPSVIPLVQSGDLVRSSAA